MTRPPAHKLETVHYSPDELSTYHKNPRRGDIDAIAESLQVNGQYRPIVVNLGRHTGRPLEVLAGNHTLKAAQQLGWTQITATTIAAHHTGRTAYMVELDPVYCDVICRRWQAHTGQAPHRDGDPNPTSF